jgi:hypothetical protein
VGEVPFDLIKALNACFRDHSHAPSSYYENSKRKPQIMRLLQKSSIHCGKRRKKEPEKMGGAVWQGAIV